MARSSKFLDIEGLVNPEWLVEKVMDLYDHPLGGIFDVLDYAQHAARERGDECVVMQAKDAFTRLAEHIEQAFNYRYQDGFNANLSHVVDLLTVEEEAATARGEVFDAALLALAREAVLRVAMGARVEETPEHGEAA